MNYATNYWLGRNVPHRLSRRRLLRGAAALGAGATALGLVGCGDGDDVTPDTGGATAEGATATAGAVRPQRGGVYRSNSANNTWDTFDSDRSLSAVVANIVGLTNQGVLGWRSYKDSIIDGQFAELPEQPDEMTYVFKVQEGLVWHDKPPVDGRAAHAEDIVYFVERNKAGVLLDGSEPAAEEPGFFRKTLFQNIESVDAIDANTVRLTTTRPWPFLLNLLAGPWAIVQAHEAVEAFEGDYAQLNSDHVIGTGAFELSFLEMDGEQIYRRSPAGARQPWLDGQHRLPGLVGDAVAWQAAFEDKRVDTFGSNDAIIREDIKSRLAGQIYERSFFPAVAVSGWYYGGAPPWDDPRLIGGIFRALDRRALLNEFWEGRGALSGVGPPAWTPFALSDEELSQLPGYLEDRAVDEAEAKKMWDAGGGPELGDITIDVMQLFENINPGAANLFSTQLQTVLGNQVSGRIVTPVEALTKRAGRKYGNGENSIALSFGIRPEDPDLSLHYPQWFTEGTANFEEFGVAMPDLQPILRKLEAEFDLQARIDLCHEAELELLANWGGGFLPLLQPELTNLYWNYLQLGETVQFSTTHNDWRDLWLDQTDRTWQGRPA